MFQIFKIKLIKFLLVIDLQEQQKEIHQDRMFDNQIVCLHFYAILVVNALVSLRNYVENFQI